jgi:methyl-accepting chemotaxis protein
MQWQNLKIGTKIGLGFALMMLIAMLIGSASFLTLTRIKSESSSLSNEYIPFIGNSAQISQDWKEITGQLQVYDITGDPYYLKRVRSRLTTCKAALDRLIEISGSSKALQKNKVEFEQIKEKISAYESNLNTYEGRVTEYTVSMEQMENAIAAFDLAYGNQAGRDPAIARIAALMYEIYGMAEQAMRSEKPVLLRGMEQKIDMLRRNWSAGRMPQSQLELFDGASSLFTTRFPDAKKIELARLEMGRVISWDIKGITDIGLDGALSFGTRTTETIRTVRQILFIAAFLLIIIGSTLIYFITRSITAPIQRSIEVAHLLAEGDLTQKLDLSRKDEIGILANALNSVGENLQAIIKNLSEYSVVINESSNKLLESAGIIADGSRQQAAASEQMSASMEQMYANIQQNSEHAQETERIAKISAEKINKSKDSFQQAAVSLKDITEEVSIIKDISFQTNLLALNAAIEAARAGEHGRGFAVVAGEVKRLAEKSNLASGRITEVSGSTLAISSAAKEEMVELVPQIEKTARLIQEIAVASMEQTAGVDQVNNAMQQLNDVVQSNAERADELNSHSRQLSEQAKELQKIIGSFKIEDESQKGKFRRKAND